MAMPYIITTEVTLILLSLERILGETLHLKVISLSQGLWGHPELCQYQAHSKYTKWALQKQDVSRYS